MKLKISYNKTKSVNVVLTMGEDEFPPYLNNVQLKQSQEAKYLDCI